MKKLLIILFLLLSTTANAQTFYSWRYRSSTDCTGLTGGKAQDLCKDTDDGEMYVCLPSAGDCDTAGEWVQVDPANASTATALAANGANCSSGNSPLGVDASGAVESCFDVATQTELNAITLDSLTDVGTVSVVAGRVLVADGTDYESVATSGDVTIASGGAMTIGSNTVALGTDTTGNYATSSSEGGSATTVADTDFGDVTVSGGVWSVDANSIALSDLSDVNSTTVTAGRLMMADGTDFESVGIISGDVALSPSGQLTINADKVTENMLKAVDTAADEEFLTYETTTGDFEWQTGGAGASTLADLTDVNTTTATRGNLLMADGTDWESITAYGDATILGSGEIKLETCSVNQILKSTGNGYVCAADETGAGGGDEVSIDSVAVTNPDFVSTGNIDFVNTANTVTANINNNSVGLTILSDVASATVTAGRMLIADGTDWESLAVTGDIAVTGAGVTSVQSDSVVLTTDTTGNYAAGDAEAGNATGLVCTDCVGASDADFIGTAGTTAGFILVNDGTDYEGVAMSGDATISSAGVVAVVANTIALSDLSDVNSTTATAGRLLMADGTDFESVGIISGDVALSPSGQLTINADKVTEAMLKAVDVAADEESLTYETTTGDFEWQSAGAASTLADLTDVNTTTASEGRLLVADGTDFESVAMSGDVTIDRSAVATVVNNSISLSDLSDVNSTTASLGRMLVSDGTDFESVELRTAPCVVIENVAAADDNFPLGSRAYPRTITKVGCRCHGTCTTKANIALEDDSGNAMTHSTPTCAVTGAQIVYQSVTAAGTLASGEGLRMDVTNAVSPETDEYEVCWDETFSVL